ALPLAEEALSQARARLLREIATAPEGDALALARRLPRTRDSYLAITRHISGTDARAYQAVWDGKAAITRLLQRRHSAARLAGTDHAREFLRLAASRRRTEAVLHEPGLSAEQRDRTLAALATEQDVLERELSAALPALGQQRELDRLGPSDLIALLPADAV